LTHWGVEMARKGGVPKGRVLNVLDAGVGRRPVPEPSGSGTEDFKATPGVLPDARGASKQRICLMTVHAAGALADLRAAKSWRRFAA